MLLYEWIQWRHLSRVLMTRLCPPLKWSKSYCRQSYSTKFHWPEPEYHLWSSTILFLSSYFLSLNSQPCVVRQRAVVPVLRLDSAHRQWNSQSHILTSAEWLQGLRSSSSSERRRQECAQLSADKVLWRLPVSGHWTRHPLYSSRINPFECDTTTYTWGLFAPLSRQ